MLKLSKASGSGPEFKVTVVDGTGTVFMSKKIIDLLKSKSLTEIGDMATDFLKEFQLRDIETEVDTFGQVGFIPVEGEKQKLVLGRDDRDNFLITQMRFIDPDDGQYAFAVTQEQLDKLLSQVK